MYYNDQIVHNIDTNKPITSNLAYSGKIKRHTHYISPQTKQIVCPINIKEATKLLKNKKIIPSLKVDKSHCPDCRFWLSNVPTEWCKSIKHKKAFPILRETFKNNMIKDGYKHGKDGWWKKI